ncbi:hypothetical protein ABZ921_02340 [Streptomyces atriruber]|uniref:Secreted protein n=1 Tax=Streptomyces atriruber TaxID=545121 RepID=A0ABV3BFZ9_9ACTN
MANRGRILKITAALTLSSLALTGFTTGRGHGGSSRHGGGGGGGGCSNSSQDHDSSSSSSSGSSGSGSSGSSTSGSGYDDDDVYGSSSGGRDGDSGGTRRRLPNDRSTASSSPEGRRTEDGKAKLVRCATKAAPYATVKVTNDNAKAGRFWVSVTFVDAEGITIIEQSEKIKVPANGKATTRVEIGGGGLVDSLDHCEVDPQALPVSG